jgi:flagellar protein FliJ
MSTPMRTRSGRAIDLDRGLRAVARVRGVRERDSRAGLQLALAEHASRQDRVATLTRRLDDAPAELSGTPGDVVGRRLGLDALGEALRSAREDADAQRVVTDAARARWQADKARLEAVETLLDQRAQARRAEADRQAAKELDDLASVRWTRDQEALHERH